MAKRTLKLGDIGKKEKGEQQPTLPSQPTLPPEKTPEIPLILESEENHKEKPKKRHEKKDQTNNLNDEFEQRIAALENLLKSTPATIDPIVIKTWDAIYQNFTTRHKNIKNIKKSPLHAHYAIMNDFFHPKKSKKQNE